MENQNDKSDLIAPAQSLSAANTMAATAEQALFLMRFRLSYTLYVYLCVIRWYAATD
jgi:hypothetical protein